METYGLHFSPSSGNEFLRLLLFEQNSRMIFLFARERCDIFIVIFIYFFRFWSRFFFRSVFLILRERISNIVRYVLENVGWLVVVAKTLFSRSKICCWTGEKIDLKYNALDAHICEEKNILVVSVSLILEESIDRISHNSEFPTKINREVKVYAFEFGVYT